jgi:hypothetical protein
MNSARGFFRRRATASTLATTFCSDRASPSSSRSRPNRFGRACPGTSASISGPIPRRNSTIFPRQTGPALWEIKANLRFKPVYRFDLDSIPADARTKLLRVREALGHFRFYDNLAIALAIVCALGLVLLRRSSAGVGFVLLFFGAGEFGACLLAQKIVSSIPPNPEIPRELLAYLPQFVAHLMEPLRLFGICAGAAGLLLIFIAFAMYVIRKFGAKEPAA